MKNIEKFLWMRVEMWAIQVYWVILLLNEERKKLS